MTASDEAQQLGHVLADWREADDEPEGDDRATRREVAGLLARLSDDEFEPMGEAVEDALGDEPEAIVAEDLERRLTAAEDADDDDLDGEARRAIGRLVGRLDADRLADLAERVADALECEPGQIERHRERQRYRINEGTDIVVEDGQTWHLSGVPCRRHPVLNWEIEPLSRLDLPGENLLAEVEIRTQDGKAFTEVIDGGVFDDRREFGETFLGLTLGMEFDSGPGKWPTERVLMTKLNKYLASRDVPERVGTEHMGLHGDEWVLPRGALTPDGWNDEPETVYIDSGASLEEQVVLAPEHEDFDRDGVATILRELPKTRPPEAMLPVLGWFYTAPLRPHIFEMEKEYNLLNVTGDTGAAKTATLRYLWRCFGMKSEPLTASDTPFAVTKTLAASNAVPVWYDEYRISDIKYPDAFHNLLRKAATGSVEMRGRPDQTTDKYELRAPVAVSGEHEIQRPAVRRRSIMVTFKKGTTGEGTRWREAYKRLAGEAFIEDDELVIPDEYPNPTDHALAYLQHVTALDRETVTERWHDALREVKRHLETWGRGLELDDLEVQGLQTIVFGWTLYKDFAEQMGVEPDELPGEDAIEAALRAVAGAVGPGGQRKSHLDRFIELIAQAARTGHLEEGREYTIVRAGKADEELRFNLDSTYAGVSKYVRDHDLDGEDLLATANDYRRGFRERYCDPESDDDCVPDPVIVNYRLNSPPVGRAVGIKIREAADRLEFEPSAFGSGVGSGAPPEADADPGVRTLSNLPPGGYVDIEAEVAVIESGAPGGGPGCSGALRDETATVDMVCWREMGSLSVGLEAGESYRFTQVSAGTHNEAPQVEIVPGVTEVEQIQAGAGNTPGDDPGENEELATVANGVGDIEDATGRVNEYLRVHHEPDDEVTVGLVAGSTDLSPGGARGALDTLAERGRLLRVDADTFEVV